MDEITALGAINYWYRESRARVRGRKRGEQGRKGEWERLKIKKRLRGRWEERRKIKRWDREEVVGGGGRKETEEQSQSKGKWPKLSPSYLCPDQGL